MPEATVNRTNQKKQNKKKEKKPEGNVSARVSSEFPQGFGFFGVFVFFVLFVFFVFFVFFGFLFFFGFWLFLVFLFFFLLNCAKSFLVELWADKRMQKVDLGGGRAYIYIYVFLYTHIMIQHINIIPICFEVLPLQAFFRLRRKKR